MARLEFRPAEHTDEAGIGELLQQQLGMGPAHPMVQPQHLHWKYWEKRGDWAGSRSYVMVQDGQIVAHGAVTPGSCEWGGRHRKVAHVIDWAARPGFGGTGVTLMKRLGQMVDALVAVDGTHATLQILPVIGFKEHGTVNWYARPIRPWARVKGAQEMTWRLMPQALRSLLWSMTAPSHDLSSWSSRRIGNDQLCTNRIPWPTSTSEFVVCERTEALMSYMLRCPACPLILHGVEKDGKLRGYFVLAFTRAQARLVDCWMDSDDASEWCVMVQLAVREAKRDHSIAEVVSMCSDPYLTSALVHSGFHVRSTRPLLMRANSGVTVPPAGIRFTMLDNDSAYLHNGLSQFWA